MIFINVGRVRKQRLEAAGIFVEGKTLNDGSVGVIFEDERLQSILTALNAVEVERYAIEEGSTVVRLRYNRTVAPGVATEVPVTPVPAPEVVAPPPPVKKFTCTYGPWESRYQPSDIFEIIQALLIPYIQMNVEVSVRSHYVDRLNTRTDLFQVHVHSSAHGGTYGDAPPAKVFGITLNGGRGSFTSSLNGTPILDEESGEEVGEIINNNLFIFPNVLEEVCASSTEIFKKFLVKAVEIMKSPLDSAEMKAREEEFSRNRYVSILQSKKKVILTNTLERIKVLNTRVNNLRSQLIEEIRKKNAEESLKSQLEVLMIEDEKGRDIYEKQFKQLYDIYKVKRVMIRGTTLAVETDTLFCTDPRSKILHEIGRFNIKINTSTGAIRWSNLDRNVEGMQAPHVFEDGHACMGNSEEIFSDLISKFELPTAIMMAINFVESVNVDDGAGTKIRAWPRAAVQPQEKKEVNEVPATE